MASLPYGFPTLSTQVYKQVLNQADTRGNRDGKVSSDELAQLSNHYSAIRFIQFDQGHANRQQALDVMRNHFSHFAGNRGQHPGSIRTLEFIIGRDDHIEHDEIDGVASGDGNRQSISTQDVLGPFTQPPSNPNPTPSPNPNPPQFNIQQIVQLLRYLLQFLRF
jgi:hypothetical protein